MISDSRLEELCEAMHDAYETAAVAAGWETQARSRKPWADVPDANKQTMRHAVRALLGHLTQTDLLAMREQFDVTGRRDTYTHIGTEQQGVTTVRQLSEHEQRRLADVIDEARGAESDLALVTLDGKRYAIRALR